MKTALSAIVTLGLSLGLGCGKEETKKDPAPEASKDLVKTPDKKPDKKPEKKPDKKPDTAKVQKKAPAEFASTDHKFTVMAMHKPRISKPAAAGAMTSYMFSAPGAPGAYMILVAKVPVTDKTKEADLKKFLTDGRDGIVKKYGAKISSDKEIKIGDHHARDFSFSASHPKMGDMVGRSKILIRGSDLIQVMRVGKPSAAALIAEADGLIDSFKLTE